MFYKLINTIIMKKIYFFLVAMAVTSLSFGQTTGDVAFTAFNADGQDDLAIVALADIAANTTIYISDNELNGAGGFVDANEGELTWETGGAIITAGTIVTFTDISLGVGSTISHGSITAGSGLNLGAGGDAVFMFLGTDPNTPTTFLAGIQNEIGNEGDLTGSGLTAGTTFVTFTTSGNPDGGEYTGPRASETTFSNYLALIGNPANWTLPGDIGNGELILPIDLTPFSEAAMATPTITVGSAVSGLDYYENNGPSNEDTFTVQGTNLTADIMVAAPTNFEVSTTSGSGFGASVNLTQTGGTVSTQTIYTRLAAGLTSNPYSGDVTASSAGATNKTVALSGTVSPDTSQITIGGSVGALNYIFGAGPSIGDDFTVEGLFLTTDIVVTAPTSFEVSLTLGSGYATSVNVPFGSGTVATTTIYTRLSGSLAVNTYIGDINITSTGVSTETISLNGEVFGAPTNTLVLTGVYDGPISGTPKGIELVALADIADLSKFGISSITNGAGSSAGAIEYTFPADAITAGTKIFLSTESTNFNSFFGQATTYTSGVVGINGNDAIELYENGVIIDTFGDVDTDGTGELWEYMDGWAYRNDGTGPDGGFVIGNWTFSGINVFDGLTTNAAAAPSDYPIASYVLSIANHKIEGFSIFPNPTNGSFITITTANNTPKNVQVFDMLGKKVIDQEVATKLNITALQTGIYIIKVTENNLSATKRLIVK
jgi:hypothetical protein